LNGGGSVFCYWLGLEWEFGWGLMKSHLKEFTQYPKITEAEALIPSV